MCSLGNIPCTTHGLIDINDTLEIKICIQYGMNCIIFGQMSIENDEFATGSE